MSVSIVSRNRYRFFGLLKRQLSGKGVTYKFIHHDYAKPASMSISPRNPSGRGDSPSTSSSHIAGCDPSRLLS